MLLKRITLEEFRQLYPGSDAMSEVNEHAQNLREAAERMRYMRMSESSRHCDAAAAEIERLQSRIWEIQHYPEILQEATLRPAYVPTNPPKVLGYDVMVDGKSVAVLKPEDVPTDRPWLPIASAPRDGTRVELWFPDSVIGPAARYGRFQFRRGYWEAEHGVEFGTLPTHWRREPQGPTTPSA